MILERSREQVKRSAPAEELQHAEIASVSLRFWISLASTVLVIGLALVVPQLGGHVYAPRTQRWGAIAQFVLSTPAVLWGGWPLYLRAWAGAKNGSSDRYTLIGTAAGIAYAYSVLTVLWPELFPDAFRGTHGMVTAYFTVATVIVTLALLVELLGSRRRRRAGS